LDWDRIIDKLHRDGDWTSLGAERVANLAQQYGSFVLRNALALSLVLKIEDGELQM
jgi:hypothetical protein